MGKAKGASVANGPGVPPVFRDWQFRLGVWEARTTIWDVQP